jgi:hypothetical protein
MSIKVTSKIEEIISEQLGSNSQYQNEMESVNESTDTTKFIVDQVIPQTFLLDTTQGAAFTKDVLAVITDKTLIKFIHIQCVLLEETTGDTNDPARFTFVLGAQALGTVTQFQWAAGLTFPDIAATVSNILVPTGRKAILNVIIGVDQA